MTDDTISRQAAIDALSAILDNPNHAEFLYGDEICKTLQDLPSAERRGRWEGAGMGDYMCSRCSEVVSGNRYHYCPNCGAFMEVEE